MEFEQWNNYKMFLSEIYNQRSTFYVNFKKPSSTNNDKRKFECWHYTSIKSLTNIFKSFIDSDSNEINSFNLFASNIRFMNDSQEYEDGRKLFLDKVSKLAINHQNTVTNYNADAYIISFCEKGDLLSQWRGYGNESGVSFCFLENNATYKTYTRKDKAGKEMDPFPDVYTKPLPVIYDNDDKTKYFKKLQKLLDPKFNCAVSHIELLGPLFIPFCKNSHFFEENEQRLIFYTTHDLLTEPDCTASFDYVYNTFGKNVKPALNVTVNRKSSDLIKNYFKYEKVDDPLISRMIVGPGYNQQIIFNMLIHIFDKKNRDNYMFYAEKNSNDEKDVKLSQNIKKSSPLTEATIKYDREPHIITCDDGVERVAYKCSNGLLIMKSAIPFRS